MSETTKLNGQNLSPEEEIKNLRIQLRNHNDELHDLRRRFLLEQDSNIRTASQYLMLERQYEFAVEELVYREEYFRLYESKFVKFCTKTLMKFKILKGKVKSYVNIRYPRSGTGDRS